ncbi:unnamed protein product [Moneuplotes crassus]|uniref:EF-hand domain-containing protein n=1 Tax=Euplotes crassus TaxID=5936 RepID=A0AAD1XVL5_EUPCR|nr:unnamed protein product [Moneuplotes crassus]
MRKQVQEFINDPDKLIKYKNKHFKNSKDTSEIDSLIHKARIYQKKQQMKQTEDASQTFDKELQKLVRNARIYLKKQKKIRSAESRSLINASILNCNKAMEAFLYVYPTDPERRKRLINKTDGYGRTALTYACYHGNYEAMSLLLAAGADACIADSNLMTPLHYVSRNEDPRLVELLFLYSKQTTKVKISQEGLPPDQRDIGALARAELSEDEEEVIGLKDFKIDSEEEDVPQKEKSNIQDVSKILREIDGFRIINGDEDKRESFEYADNPNLLNFRDKLGRTALHYSCFYGSIGIVEDLSFLKANPWLEDAYHKRAIDLIQEGEKHDDLVKLCNTNMKVSKPTLKGLTKGLLNRTKKKQKKGLKSLEIDDLKLVPKKKIVSERIGINSDNYLSFALRSENFEASKYLHSLNIFPLDFQNSSGYTYYHCCIISQRQDLLKLIFLDPEKLEEPYNSKAEVTSEDFEVNPEVFRKKIFEITSNKKNNILNCCAEYGSDESFDFLYKIFTNHYNTDKRRKRGRRILETEDDKHKSVLYKCVLKEQDHKLEQMLNYKEMISEKDLFEVSKYLEGNKDTKLGATKQSMAASDVAKEKVNIFVNKIWNYLKDKNLNKFTKYVQNRAEAIHNAYPKKEADEIYSEIINDQKRGSLFTPLHFAIKNQNLPLIRELVYTYNADMTLENKDGHDPVEYLHLGPVNAEIPSVVIDTIDDLLHKRTKSIKYDKDKKFHEIVRREDQKEREELMETINKFKESVLNSGRNLRFIFEKLDLDNNGTLTPDEIKAAFTVLEIEGDCDKVLKYSDTNKDGMIDYDEFCNFLYQTESEMESEINRFEMGSSQKDIEEDQDDEQEGEQSEEEQTEEEMKEEETKEEVNEKIKIQEEIKQGKEEQNVGVGKDAPKEIKAQKKKEESTFKLEEDDDEENKESTTPPKSNPTPNPTSVETAQKPISSPTQNLTSKDPPKPSSPKPASKSPKGLDSSDEIAEDFIEEPLEESP